ncbi:MAG: hypothetical protein WDM78_02340 [Puia sp.]
MPAYKGSSIAALHNESHARPTTAFSAGDEWTRNDPYDENPFMRLLFPLDNKPRRNGCLHHCDFRLNNSVFGIIFTNESRLKYKLSPGFLYIVFAASSKSAFEVEQKL